MKGRYLSLSVPRRIVSDLMYFSGGVPWIVVEKEFDLSETSKARESNAQRPGWAALFVKAYAVVSQEMPPLRQAYAKLPWPHLYEYPIATAVVAVNRMYGDEEGLAFVHIGRAAKRPLSEISEKLRASRTSSLDEDPKIRRMAKVARLPLLIRRPVWWLVLNLGFAREKLFGTFGLSAIAATGAEIQQLRAPQTTSLTYGALDANNKLRTRLVFDHRVMDAMTAAKALARLEEVLNGEIARELRG